ncbi:uncharacterized protein OGAPODRAFT_94272 [Ogataea polymorpha]|uniref:uncharacterized protein n=1 Tax=Ogataea polymorpha TaxID=460523 RepID=UPI0007F3A68D|nr:uncharacterized protein OGAPODRAFT_94272 [Ogataea polymorpha]OBA15838.1 hypothetical protein OGAPODRAFT_94272 [Ogataea polymorpha]
MDVTTQFGYASVNRSINLQWVYMVEWVIALLGSIGILFYFNRLMGSILSFLLKYILWKRHKIRLKVQSYKVSFLGGRLFFKNVTIITKNEMILIHQGWLTWRYWLTSVRQSGFVTEPENTKNGLLPTRLLMEIYGLEVFVYNRMNVYEELLEKLNRESSHAEKQSYSTSHSSESSSDQNTINDSEESGERYVPQFIKLLPLKVLIKQGGFVIGNQTTTSLLVGSYTSLEGLFDFLRPASKYDKRRVDHDIRANQLQLYLKPNVSYEGMDQITKEFNGEQNHKFKRFLEKLGLYHNGSRQDSQKTKEEELHRWRGLERYLSYDSSMLSSFDESTPSEKKEDALVFSQSEYARYTHVFDSDYVDIHYYYDIPGNTPASAANISAGEPDVGNGEAPPANNIDISVSEGVIHYGPWAEKERALLHQMLFPSVCRDAEPMSRPKAGSKRRYEGFKLFIESVDDLVLRIPFRESSKDILYSNSDSSPNQLERRPFGWLELKVGQNSTFNISTSYIPSAESGWSNKFHVDFNNPVISSSVNHEVFFKAMKHTINADVGYPLQWNGAATWSFQNRSTNAELYLLREHIELLTDMFGDFSSGNPTPYELFRPFFYKISWKVYNYNISLNLNEKNIVSHPLDYNDNIYVSFCGSELDLAVGIPLDTVYRKSTFFDYKLNTTFDLAVHFPPWHTGYNFLRKKEVGRANNFEMSGSFTYFNVIDIDTVDNIVVNCVCEDTTLECYGFIIKYVLLLKANYFGEDINFQTLGEFLEDMNDKSGEKPAPEEFKPFGIKLRNETDLHFSFCVKNGCLVLPAHNYDCETHVALHFESLDIDLRFNNYYMDLQANFSEIYGRSLENADEDMIFSTTSKHVKFDPQLFIDHLPVHGHRAFGLPPDEPTYYCRWDFHPGQIVVESEPIFLDIVRRSFGSLAVGYNDSENSLDLPEEVIFDMLNLSFSCPEILLKINGPSYGLSVQLETLHLTISDQSSATYNSRINFKIENIVLQGVNDTDTVMDVRTSVYASDFVKKPDFDTRKEAQRAHIKIHDAPFHRCPFLLSPSDRDKTYHENYGGLRPFLNFPDVPPPLNTNSVDLLILSYPERLKASLRDDENSDSSSFPGGSMSCAVDSSPKISPENDGFEVDSIVCSFGTIDGYIDPKIALVLSYIISNKEAISVTNVLDEIQNDFISHLTKKHATNFQKVNIKALMPMITLKVTDSRFSENCVDISISNPAFTAAIKPEGGLDSFAADISGLSIQILKSGRSVCSLDATKLKTDLFNSKLSTSVMIDEEHLYFDVDPTNLQWVENYISILSDPIKTALAKISEAMANSAKAKIDTVYSLSKGGTDYSVRHDPSCITKPSYISKFSDEHIRREDSWKIITRIRHIAYNLPKSWHAVTQKRFDEHSWNAPEDAKETVFDIFLNWRRWEFSNISSSYVLMSVFGDTTSRVEQKSFSLTAALSTSKLNVHPFKNLVVIENLELALSKEKLSEELYQMATELSMINVHDQINVGVSIGALNTSISSMKKSIPYINDLVANMASKANTKQVVEITNKSEPDPIFFSTNILFKEFSHQVAIDRSSVNVRGSNSVLTMSGIKTSKDLFFAMLCNNTTLGIDIMLDKMKIAHLNCFENSLLVSKARSTDHGQIYVDLSTSNINVSAGSGSDFYLKALDVLINEEYEVLAPLINNLRQSQEIESQRQESPVTESSNGLFAELKGKVTGSLFVSKLSLQLEVLSPILYKMDVQDIAFEFSASDRGATSNLTVSRIRSRILSTSTLQQVQFGTVSVGTLKVLTSFIEKYGRFDVFAQVHADQLGINCSQRNFIYLAKLAETDYGVAEEYFKKFRSRFHNLSQLLGCKSNHVSKSSDSSFIVKAAVAVALNNFSFTCLLNDNRAFLDCGKITMKFATSDFNYTGNKPQGFLKLPSMRFSMLSHGPQTSRFTICDINLELKGSTSVSSEQKLHEVELISDHCRFVLDSHFTRELLDVYFDFQKKFNTYKFPRKPAPRQNVSAEAIWDLLSFYSIRIVSKNMCIGWLLPKPERTLSNSSDIPGFIVGYEKAEIVCSTKTGNVLVSSLYLATAHGNNSMNFYSTSDESLSANRAYFPRFELDYQVSQTAKGRDIDAELHGDKVDFKLETTLFSVADRLAWSVVHVQEKLETMISHEIAHSETADGSPTLFSSIHSNLRLIGCIFAFNGASIMIINPATDPNHKPTSLCLQAPSVRIATEYIRCRDSVKKHVVSIQAVTSSTDNALSASCVPVIVSLVKSVKSFANRNHAKKRKLPATRKPEERRLSVGEKESVGVSLERIFEKFKINFSLKVEPQRLTLSCEPSAKVEAAVSTNGLFWHFNTDTDLITTTICIEQLRAKLHHVYSKETSGSLGINDILLSATVAKADGVKTMSNTSKISNIDSYLNIQQRQDVDIFREIWLPSELYKVSVEKPQQSEDLSLQNIAARVKDMSDTTVLPWILTLLVGKVKLKVDLGFSLGTLDVEADKCWVKSTKVTNRDQNLKLELGQLRITSEGRLGGLLVVERARMASAISWSKERGMENIPLVFLSAGFRSLETKISLDYHIFCIAVITKAMASIYNKSVDNNADKLVGKTSMESLNVYMTALTASNFVDIYTIGLRIRQDIKISYHQTLNDALDDQTESFKDSMRPSESSLSLPASRKTDSSSSSTVKTVEMFLDVIDEFYTDLDVRIGSMQLQIFPSSLLDTQALVIRVGASRAKFEQIKTSIMENKLDMNLDNFTVALSSFKTKPTEASLREPGVRSYAKLANTAVGGSIFVFPSLNVYMDAFQPPGSNLVKFKFSSSFGGNVDVRWKLGSVYFIREMWYSHATTLKTRLTALRIFTSGYGTDFDDLLEENYKESIFEAVNLEDRLKDVESDEKYVYVPLEEPHIETPRLRDLGNATPPLEWFGLHRNKFPNLTHQFVIVGLQQLVKEAETRYANVLK